MRGVNISQTLFLAICCFLKGTICYALRNIFPGNTIFCWYWPKQADKLVVS